MLIISCKKEIDNSLTETEIEQGVKTVLLIGTDSAVNLVSSENGFMQNKSMQIILPDEGRIIPGMVEWYMLNAEKYPRFQKLKIDLGYSYERTLLSLNMAAGRTVSEMDTLLKMQIRSFQYSNGLSLVIGKEKESDLVIDSVAITNCFKRESSDSLYKSYYNSIIRELDKENAGSDTSCNIYWTILLDKFNLIADNARNILIEDSIVGGVLTNDKKTMLRRFVQLPDTTIIANYLTNSVLDRFFYKIGNIEKQIRQNPSFWDGKTNGGIIQRVFGNRSK